MNTNEVVIGTRLLYNLIESWADFHGRMEVDSKREGKLDKTLTASFRFYGENPYQFDQMDHSKVNPVVLTDGKYTKIFYFSNNSQIWVEPLKAKQDVLRHYFADWSNFEVCSFFTKTCTNFL